jgi:glucose/arabinose dehydrogenase
MTRRMFETTDQQTMRRRVTARKAKSLAAGGKEGIFKAAMFRQGFPRMIGFLLILHLGSGFPCRAEARGKEELQLAPQAIKLLNGKTFSLNVPEGYEITPAAQALKRARFMARAPDGRIFVTDLYNRADNERGAVYILDGFDQKRANFELTVRYLKNLRNPNSLAFYKDAQGQNWLYLALTDRLVRYKFRYGDRAPRDEPETLATYPDYGLNYKYGGWHLTRTIAFGEGENRDKLYVSVGSSCNACEEKEEIRATLTVMDADGGNARIIGRGLRNAVGLKMVDGTLYLTNMGGDHLGDNTPDDTLFALDNKALKEGSGFNFGWPYCYFEHGRVLADPQFGDSAKKMDCGKVPAAFATFAAHGSPLGLEHFDSMTTGTKVGDHFLVALHGSGHQRLKRGYKVIRIAGDGSKDDFITGFLEGGVVYGRPCDILRTGPDSFLLTDDYSGVIYFIHRK